MYQILIPEIKIKNLRIEAHNSKAIRKNILNYIQPKIVNKFSCPSLTPPSKPYCHVYGWLKTAFGLVIGFINNLQVVTTVNYYNITDFHTFQSTVAHALGFSVSTSLLATDLNTETSTSNHYEIILLFHLQSLWNLGTKKSSDSLLQLTTDS
jgi:hypothetical protein